MKYEDKFRKWLPENGVSDNVVDSYLSYVKGIEEVIGDIDDFLDDAIKKAIQRKIAKSNFPEKTEKLIVNYRSGARKYWQYIRDKN